MSYQDIGIRVLVLGVAEGRRSIGMFRSDISGLEREIRSLSATSAGIGTSLTNLGSALVGIGRTLSIAVTLPIAAMGGSLFRAGIEFEDSFAGVSKTVEGVAYGFREVIANDPAIQQMYLRWQALQFPIRNASNAIWDADETMHRFILSLSAADRAMIMSSDLFGQLTPAGEGLRNEFRNMALDIPISAKEIARIGEIAGQLGVPLGEGGQTLEEFTRIIALMGVTTDYATEDAAFAIARLGNIMGVEGTDLGDFAAQAASAIVALGNVSAATEPEIGNLALRIGAAGRLSGLTVPEILGISTTLAEMGIKAERGGTAVSRVLEEMIISIGEGGEGLQAFATIAGVSTAEFSENFRRDAVGTMKDFLVRMAEIQETGAPGLKQMLIDMGLSGVRVKEVMALLGLNMEALDENIEIANQAWEEQIALEEEAAKRFKTTRSQIQLMKNAFVDIGITLFDLYKNKFDNLIGKIREFALAFKKLTPANQKFLVTLGLLAAAAGPVVVVLGLFIQNLGILITALTALPSLLIRVGMLMLTQFLPVLGLLGAAAGVFYALYATNFLGIGDLIDSLGQKFKELYNSYISGSIAAVAKALKEGDFIGALNIIKGTLQALVLLFKIYFLPEIEAWADTVGKTIEEKLQQWTENLPATFAGLAEQLGEAMKTIGSSIANAVLSEEDQSKIDKFYDETIVGNWDKIREWIDNNDGTFQAGLASLWTGIKTFIKNITEKVDTEAVSAAISKIFGAGWLIVSGIIWVAGKLIEAAAPAIGNAIALFLNLAADIINTDLAGAAENIGILASEVAEFAASFLGIEFTEEDKTKIKTLVEEDIIETFNTLKAWIDKNKDAIGKKLEENIYKPIKGFVDNFVNTVDWEDAKTAVGNLLKIILGIGLIFLGLALFVGNEVLQSLPQTGEILGNFFNVLADSINVLGAAFSGDGTGVSANLGELATSLGNLVHSLEGGNVLGILAILWTLKTVFGLFQSLGTAIGLVVATRFMSIFGVSSIIVGLKAAAIDLAAIAGSLLGISVLGAPLWAVAAVIIGLILLIVAYKNNWLGLKTAVDEVALRIKEKVDEIYQKLDEFANGDLEAILAGIPLVIMSFMLGPFVGAAALIALALYLLRDKIKDFVNKEIQESLKDLKYALDTYLVEPFTTAIGTISGAINDLLGLIEQLLVKLGIITPNTGHGGTIVTPEIAASENEQRKAQGLAPLPTSIWDIRAQDITTQSPGARGHRARGGLLRGWSMVGEQGPELVFSRNNSLVIPNNWSNKIMELINRESLLTNSINRLVDRNYLGSGPQYAYYQPTFQGTPSAEMRQVNNDMYHQWLVTTGRA